MDFCLSNTDLQWAELRSYWERSSSPCLWSKVKSTVLVWMHVPPAYRSPSTQHHPGSALCYSIFGSCVLAVMGSCPCVLLPQSQVSEGTTASRQYWQFVLSDNASSPWWGTIHSGCCFSVGQMKAIPVTMLHTPRKSLPCCFLVKTIAQILICSDQAWEPV